MNKLNKRKQNNGGFISALAGLFKGGAAAGGGVAGTAATGGIFATKAGILGLLLGGATIAAGAGAVYHFVGSATNTAYAPDLFQKSYLEEEAALAGAERSQSQDRHASVNSSIGMFSAQAKKEGLGFEAREEEQQPEENSSASAQYSDEGSKASAASAAYSASSAAAPRSSSNRLTSKGLSSSFGSGGGSSSGASAPRMKSMGGLSGGINSKFASMKSASLAEGNGNAQAMASAKKASISRGRNASARGARRSARSQAMFANAMGSKAAYSSSAAGARTSAESAFTGETTGSGDVAEGVLEGAGLGGAGLSMANELKSNDPNSNNSIKNVPPVNNATNENPWKKVEEAIAYLMIAGAALFALGSIFAKLAKNASQKWKALWLGLTKAFAVALSLVGLAIMALGLTMMIEYKQYLTGGIYTLAGGIFVWKGASLWKEANNIEDKDTKKKMDDDIEKAQKEVGDKFKQEHEEPKPQSREDYDKIHKKQFVNENGEITTKYFDDNGVEINEDAYEANYNQVQKDYTEAHDKWQKDYDEATGQAKIDVEKKYLDGKEFHRGSIKNEISNDVSNWDKTHTDVVADNAVNAKTADGALGQTGGAGDQIGGTGDQTGGTGNQTGGTGDQTGGTGNQTGGTGDQTGGTGNQTGGTGDQTGGTGDQTGGTGDQTGGTGDQTTGNTKGNEWGDSGFGGLGKEMLAENDPLNKLFNKITEDATNQASKAIGGSSGSKA